MYYLKSPATNGAGDFRYQVDIQAVISIVDNLVMRISRVFQRETASLLANTDANS